jgi:uncharacterized protein (TIGR03083 family)
MQSSARTWIAALRGSQQRLAGLVATLSPEQLRGPSHDPGWSIAQVLSHIGSQADIAIQSLVGTLAGREPFGPEGFAYILAVWSARDPDQQAAQCLVSDAEHVDRLDQLTDEQLAAIRVNFFGMEFDAVGMVWLRLGEHALHSWDVAVSLDSSARVSPQSVELLADRIPQVAMRAGKPGNDRFTVGIAATDPKREFVLEVAETVTMTAVPDGTSATPGSTIAWIQMPAEALLRLVYGRLGPDHMPPPGSRAGPVDPEALRRTFPGL